jgi:hypothetical protein
MIALDNIPLLAAVVAVQSLVILVLLIAIWRMVEKLYAINIRLENLVPVSVMRELRDEALGWVKQYTESTPTTRDDWVDDLLKRVTDAGLNAVERRQQMEKIVLEIPEEGGLG